MWHVTEEDLEDIAIGAGILGTGGGGNPYRGKLLARRHLREGGRMMVVPLASVPDDALGVSVGGMGAPVIGIERIIRGDEAYTALRTLERRLGRPVTHVVPGEVGGSNSAIPLVVGAQSGLPVVDADGMGRAFPELQQTTFFIEGAAPSPAPETMLRRTGPPAAASIWIAMVQATVSAVVSRHSDTTSATIIPRALAVRGSTRLVP